MKVKSIFLKLYILLACGMLAIGRVYDERLEIFNVNISIIISGIFFLFSVPLFFSIKKIKIFRTKAFFYLFFLILLVLPLILSLYFSYDDFGVQKYFNFILIVVPIIYIVMERFDYNDVRYFFKVLLYFIITLSVIGLFVVLNSSERLSVLGGGPIVFARWMNVGLIIIFFISHKKLSKYSVLLMLFFLLLSLASGSRGPILSLIITSFLFLLLNAHRLLLRIFFFFILIGSISVFTSVNSSILDVGKTERLITKDSRSKNARVVFVSRSFELVSHYPLGIGLGNWQTYANQINRTHLLKHQYPHNLLLEICVELGVIPAILLLILLIKVLYFSYKRMYLYRNEEYSFYPLLFYLQFYLILTSFFSGSLNDSRLLFVIMAIALIGSPLILKHKE